MRLVYLINALTPLCVPLHPKIRTCSAPVLYQHKCFINAKCSRTLNRFSTQVFHKIKYSVTACTARKRQIAARQSAVGAMLHAGFRILFVAYSLCIRRFDCTDEAARHIGM
mmetsp:Transcript_61260/g.101953  ORF Transcript_61260/g.101953 Transcript_61260/m.101953 type:complete len:111 (+) Transcript_61260:936-1268(+)